MKKFTCCGVFACLMWLFASNALAALDIAAANDLANLLSGFHSLTADFTQVIYDANNQPIQHSTGSMALSRPGKFRWQVKQPNAQLLIADGQYLWIYDKDLSQATRQKFDQNQTTSPASLLSGSLEDLKTRFNVTRLNTSNGVSFRLVPKATSDLFKWIELSFVDNKLTHMRLLDNLGSRSIFQFTATQLNPQLGFGLFQFKPPKGVDVIQNS